MLTPDQVWIDLLRRMCLELRVESDVELFLQNLPGTIGSA